MKPLVEKGQQCDPRLRPDDSGEAAFRELFDLYHSRLLHTAYRLCGNMQAAEDITQEVFIKVHREISNFQAASSMFTWLYRITVNLCLDKMRRQNRRAKFHVHGLFDWGKSEHDDAISHESSLALDQEIWQGELQQMLHKALGRIKPKLRTAIVLKDLEGLSYEEVAQIAGCSQGTVSSRLNRGRQQLRKVLAQMGLDKTYFYET